MKLYPSSSPAWNKPPVSARCRSLSCGSFRCPPWCSPCNVRWREGSSAAAPRSMGEDSRRPTRHPEELCGTLVTWISCNHVCILCILCLLLLDVINQKCIKKNAMPPNLREYRMRPTGHGGYLSNQVVQRDWRRRQRDFSVMRSRTVQEGWRGIDQSSQRRILSEIEQNEGSWIWLAEGGRGRRPRAAVMAAASQSTTSQLAS